MKPNFLSLIHETAKDKKRMQSLRQETDKSQQGEAKPSVSQQRESSDSQDENERHQTQFDPQMQIVLERRLPYVDDIPSEIPQKQYLNDIDRRLAVFYHPLFLEITEEWIKLLLGPASGSVRDQKINFITFIEMNLRLQKSLLAKFDLSSAFVSALKDWVKELGDCLQMKSLYLHGDTVNARDQMSSLPFEPALAESDYQKFFDQQKGSDIYKFLGIKVSTEVCSKFLFDLCMSWCQHLDIELFAQLLLGLLLQISEGAAMSTARLVPLKDAKLLPMQFLEDFQQAVQLYGRYKRKNLSYYRAWCEWNYLRMEEIGEAVLGKLLEHFPDDERAEGLIDVFSKAIEVINQEITHQVKATPAKKAAVQEQESNEQQKTRWETRIDNFRQQNQDQYLSQDYYLDRIQPLIPDQFIISYNEYEQAFILERKVAMPIIGHKIGLQEVSWDQRCEQSKQLVMNRKEAYVYYVSDQLSPEAQAEMLKNVHKAKRLPLIQRRKPSEHPLKAKTITPRARRQLNNSFSHPEPAEPTSTNALAPTFMNEGMRTDELRQTALSTYNPVYNTQKKTWEDFSTNIEYQRREIRTDIPKEVIRSNFRGTEFVKLVTRKGFPQQMGRINKPQHPPAVQPNLHFAPNLQSPMENQRIAQQIENRLESVEELNENVSVAKPTSVDQEQHPGFSQPVQVGRYSLHNVGLTFEQQDSLYQNRHLWEPFLSWDEVRVLRQDDNKFYHILQLLKLKFNQEHKSEYLKQLGLEFNYASRRDEMGGVINALDRERFHSRIEKLIERDKRRKERRKRRRKNRQSIHNTKINPVLKARAKDWEIKTSYKNDRSKNNYREVFINPHKT